jgi:uncharacterized protein (TIGR02145 family)
MKRIVHSLQSTVYGQKLLLKLLVLLLTINYQLLTINCFSQGVSINLTGAAADNSAMLDVSSSSQGLLIPRMTTTQRDGIISPALSLLIFNTTTKCFEAYVSGSWYSVSCPPPCSLPSSPTAGTSVPSQTQIIWNWNTVNGAAGYKWNTVNNYASASDNGASTSYTQGNIICNTSDSLYVWAYNGCGNSAAATLRQATPACAYVCGADGTFIDARDGQIYGYVNIGSQTWMCQNLNYGIYTPSNVTTQQTGYKYCQNLNGVTDPACPMGGFYSWANMMQGALQCNGTCSSADGLCDGPGDRQRCASPIQGLCPNGWHVPSHYEWNQLEQAICAQNGAPGPGSNCITAFPYDVTTMSQRGTTEGTKMKTGTDWNTGSGYIPGTNSSGFTALPGGMSWWGSFRSAGILSVWWTATEYDPYAAWFRSLYYYSATVNRFDDNKIGEYSVRCVKD